MECNICCEKITTKLRKAITCPISTCEKYACIQCYKTYLLSNDVPSPKCMNCQGEFTPSFLKKNFPYTFLKNELKKHKVNFLFNKEKEKFQQTQHLVQRKDKINEINIQLKKIEDEIKSLKLAKTELTNQKRSIELGYADNIAEEDVPTKTIKCCDPECNGFVSSAWKCGLCNKFSCCHCHEIKGVTKEEISNHVCKKELVDTVKLINKDTKPCPSCGVYIHKTEGCDQMFCTECKVLWSWRTQKIETRGHNPHYLEWMRTAKNGIDRDPLDVECGREIDHRFSRELFKLIPYSYSGNDYGQIKFLNPCCNSIIHNRLYEIETLRDAIERLENLTEERIKYMKKEITVEQFKRAINTKYAKRCFSRHLLDLTIAITNAGTDIFYRLHNAIFNKELSPEAIFKICENFKKELEGLNNYANECLSEIFWLQDKKENLVFKELRITKVKNSKVK